MRLLTLTLTFAVMAVPLAAADDTRKVDERLADAAELFSEIMSAPDRSIPQGLLDKAPCVVIVPGMKKGAFVVGGKYGKGFAVCRGASGQGWGPPAAIRIEGGSFGLQIGFSSTDVVLLVMNQSGMRRLTESKFTIGGEATAAAGPVGRDTTAQTDALMTAEILSWSRARGVFAGVSLDGATLRNDLDENKAMYGKPWTSKQILNSGAKPPAAAARLLSILNKYSMRKVG
ncbi:MAG TPA: lipid-binding SYLF domain-containing protein [Bryobacteraceae bacterium]|nr:lipid-binding SYLF domain-containing protein [Bryobacteraceae bacterium]